MLSHALTLARKGMAVFPCRVRDKRPATANGCLDATRDPEQIRAWWEIEPNFNLALACGPKSGVFVIDVDGAEAALQQLEEQHGALPASVEVITARGRHVYFRMPDRLVHNSAGKIAPGIDVRGDGSYVLAPPSVHPSGRVYAWSVDCANTFAAAPDWLLNKIAPSPGNGAPPAATASATWCELLRDGVDEGKRNDSVARLAGFLLRRHIDALVAFEILSAWNVARCRPPLPDDEIAAVVDSIAARELRRRGAP
jgi:hypothetical protein